jgi:hypothetical protein
MTVLNAQTTGTRTTNASSFTAIPGLSLTVPEGVQVSALVILNLPNPYAQGNDYPGGVLGISVNGTVSPVQASFTYGHPESPQHQPHADNPGRRRAVDAAAADHPGTVVRGARQHGRHRQSGDAKRRPLTG